MNEFNGEQSPQCHSGLDTIDDAAQDWFLLLRSGTATDADWTRFAAWQNADPRHRAAYDALCRLWVGIEDLGPAFAGPSRHGGHRGGTRAVPAGSVRYPAHALHRSRPGRRFAAWAMLAAACVALLVLGMPELLLRIRADFRTGIGEQAKVGLPDASTVWLNTDTAIAVEYGSGRRTVRLLHGEAEFQVAGDAARPFIVEARGGQARALGTVFAVRRHDGGATVTVSEGTVQVQSPAPNGVPSPGAPITVQAGHQVGYQDGAAPGAVSQVDPAAVLAWRSGFLSIRNLPLSVALAEIDRYHPGRIILLADTAGTEPVTARLALHDLDQGLAALAATQGLTVTRITDHLVFVR